MRRTGARRIHVRIFIHSGHRGQFEPHLATSPAEGVVHAAEHVRGRSYRRRPVRHDRRAAVRYCGPSFVQVTR